MKTSRRQFISLLGGAAALGATPSLAQQRKVVRIGILSGFIQRSQIELRVGTFREQLRAFGWIEGDNVSIDYRQSANVDGLSVAAREIVDLKPDVILTMPATAMNALWKTTRSIPIVFGNVSDPVESGYVVSLARPDGNVTGFTAFEHSLGGKWVELLKEVAPTLLQVLVVYLEDQYSSRQLLRSTQEAGRTLGVAIHPAPVLNLADIELAIERFARNGGGGLVTLPHTVITNNNRRIFELAGKHRFPAVYPFRQYALDGGLISYGSDEADAYRRAAGYVDRILKGEKPGTLPVQNPVKFQLVINLKSARTFGFDIPARLLLRADEVIE